jgi:hypothetical protein
MSAVPSFCRHNRLIANCPICSREQDVEMRPIVSSGTPRVSAPSHPTRQAGARRASAESRGGSLAARSGGLRVRRLARGAEDGFHSALVPGLKSSVDAERLAEEMAFASARLEVLADAPPGLYAEVADPSGDVEERTWLAFEIAYLSPLPGPDPFSSVSAVRVPFASGASPDLDGAELGPRTAHDPGRGAKTFEAYRAWAERAGSQAAAFTGDAAWPPARRFSRVFERLALPGLHRDARFDLLVTLGRLGVYELQAGSLELGGENPTTLGAKRALGIGDPLLLERRAADLAAACAVPLEALDLALHNWERGERATLGLGPDAEPDETAVAVIRDALGL